MKLGQIPGLKFVLRGTCVALLLAAGLGIGYLLWGMERTAFDRKLGTVPNEYLFLDNARVLTYLSQAHGGLSESEKRSLTRTKNLEFGIEAQSPVKAGGSSQSQEFVEEVVTPTAGSNFMSLMDKLGDDLKKLDTSPDFDSDFRKLAEGEFVRLKVVGMKVPVYAEDYHVLTRAGALRSGRRLTRGQRAALRRWLKRFGPSPRVAFKARVPAEGPKTVALLAPVQYKNLADEPSLLSGGDLTLVGKVVRRHAQEEGMPTLEGGEAEYIDDQTVAMFARQLRATPRMLIRKQRAEWRRELGALRRKLRRVRGSSEDARSRKDLRRQIRRLKSERPSVERRLRSLRRDTRLDGEGFVVVPIAIYK